MRNAITNALVVMLALFAITAIALAGPDDGQEEKNATLEWVLKHWKAFHCLRTLIGTL